MASVTAVTPSQSTVTKGGGTSRLVPTINDPATTANVSVSVDGSTVPLALTITEPLTFSVDPQDQGKPGYVVATVDQGGTLTVGPDGQSFVFTAS